MSYTPNCHLMIITALALGACSAPVTTLDNSRFSSDPLSTESIKQDALTQHATIAQHSHCKTTDTNRLTLADSLQIGLCHSPEAQAALALVEQSAADVGQAKADYLPKLQARYQQTNERTKASFNQDFPSFESSQNPKELFIELQWKILDFGRRDAEKQKQLAILNSMSAQYNEVLQKQWAEIAKTYVEALFFKQGLSIAQQGHQNAQQNAKLVRAFYRSGVVIKADVEQAQIDVYQAQLTTLKAKENYAKAKGRLAQKLGLDITTVIDLAAIKDSHIVNPKKVSDIKAMMAKVKQAHPSVIAAKSLLNAKTAQLNAVKHSYLPSVHLVGQYSHKDGLNDAVRGGFQKNESIIGLKINIPLFMGFRQQYAVQHAVAEEKQSAARLKHVEEQVAIGLWNAWQQWKASIKQYQLSKKAVAAAQHNRRSQQGRYRSGVGQLSDLLNAQKQLNQLRQSKLDALIAWYEARINLLLSLGQLNQLSGSSQPALKALHSPSI